MSPAGLVADVSALDVPEVAHPCVEGLVGPSGVGKTETAITLAETLYGGERNLVTINMSEFQEAHTVSTLKGAPAGYVGYGQGGVLTEAVRRRPYSVVLLDEVEKAHPDVHEMFFQVFDKGFMNDSEGRHIDFKNTVILLTSNVGTDLIMSLSEDEELWLRIFLDRLPEDGDLDAVTSVVYGTPKVARGLGFDDAPTDQVKADQKDFFRLLYNLLVDADRGPRLPTLVLALGPAKVRQLLGG